MPRAFWKTLCLILPTAFLFALRGAIFAQPGAAPEVPPVPALPDRPPESLLIREPTNPEEMFSAVDRMLRLGRPRLARMYLEQLMGDAEGIDRQIQFATPERKTYLEQRKKDGPPSDDELLAIRDKHGPAIFLQLARNDDLKPLSTRLLDRMNAVVRKRNDDPQRIEALINDLTAGPRERAIATEALRSAGTSAVPAMVRKLGGETDPTKNEVAVALVRMGEPAVAPLVGALDAPDENLRAQAAGILGHIGSRVATPYLWHPAFASEQPPGVRHAAREALARILHADPARLDRVASVGAAAELRRNAIEHFSNRYNWKTNEDGSVMFWLWDPAENTVRPVDMSPEAASSFAAARLSRDALGLLPENPKLQSLYVATMLGRDSAINGLDRPLQTGPGSAHDVALTSGPDLAADALAESLEHNNPAAALAAMRVLGQVGTRHQLDARGDGVAPLIAALNHPNQRVQFAAAATILELDPEERFNEANRVVAVMSRALNDPGSAAVVVTHPDVATANSRAAVFGQIGYVAVTARTGREVFRTAASRADVELIVLDLNTVHWPLSQTVANLRADVRTAGIPIAIFGPDEYRSEVSHLLDYHPRIAFLPSSQDSAFLNRELQPMLLGIRTPPLNEQQRGAQKAEAAYWLAQIASGHRSRIYPLEDAFESLSAAAEDPELYPNAMLGLSAIGTADAQKRFQQIAVDGQRDAAVREAAALQLAHHIHRFGYALAPAEGRAIEDAWRQATEPNLSTALASVVGSFKPGGRTVFERLRSLPEPVPTGVR